MTDEVPNALLWRFLDGAASVSASMLLAVALDGCGLCSGLPLLSYLNEMANREDGIIITATLLLFPTTATLYGVLRMFFAAKQAAERKARERGRKEGIKEGIKEEREQISKMLKEEGVSLSPELAKRLTSDPE